MSELRFGLLIVLLLLLLQVEVELSLTEAILLFMVTMLSRSSKPFVMLLLVACFIVITTGSLRAEDKQLTEVQKLKAENLKLKVEVAQLTATLQDRENRLKEIE